jgi:hypothetical protein
MIFTPVVPIDHVVDDSESGSSFRPARSAPGARSESDDQRYVSHTLRDASRIPRNQEDDIAICMQHG